MPRSLRGASGRRALSAALARCSCAERALLALVFVERLSLREAAVATGMPVRRLEDACNRLMREFHAAAIAHDPSLARPELGAPLAVDARSLAERGVNGRIANIPLTVLADPSRSIPTSDDGRRDHILAALASLEREERRLARLGFEGPLASLP